MEVAFYSEVIDLVGSITSFLNLSDLLLGAEAAEERRHQSEAFITTQLVLLLRHGRCLRLLLELLKGRLDLGFTLLEVAARDHDLLTAEDLVEEESVLIAVAEARDCDYLLERVRAELRGQSISLVNSLLRTESPSMSSFQ